MANTKEISIEERFKTGSLSFIQFPEDNEIHFFQDMGWWQNIPSNVRFYIREQTNNGFWFIGDGYGVQKDNDWGIVGKYGNGSIHVMKENLPEEIVKWCEANSLSKPQGASIKK